MPNFSLIVHDQCHDMPGTGTCTDLTGLISAGDTDVGDTVSAIMNSKAWHKGRDAIVITWDEDDSSDAGQPGTGCCGVNPAAGRWRPS